MNDEQSPQKPEGGYLPPKYPTAPEQPVAQVRPKTKEETQQFIADKVGLVPSLRKEDNIFQAKFIGVSLFVGIVVMCFVGPAYWDPDAGIRNWIIVGALFGLVGGALLSGLYLGIRNIWR